MLVSLCIAVFVTQVKGNQKSFGTALVPLDFQFLPLPLALGILITEELRKVVVRTWPKGLVESIAW
jgi:sodium/potassium-transporting ATPase subunit alpha